MPIRYRDYIYNQIRAHYEKKNKEDDNIQKQNALKTKTAQTAKPNVKPTYTAKRAPK
jgi:hypothetical protein